MVLEMVLARLGGQVWSARGAGRRAVVLRVAAAPVRYEDINELMSMGD